MEEGAQIEAVLGLSIEKLMERRLQTIVLRKNLANTIKQARQFITHRHITIGEHKVTSPSMLVKVEDEAQVSFIGTSQLSNDSHPERVAGIEKREKHNKKEMLEEKMKQVKEQEKAKKTQEETGLKPEEVKEVKEAQ